jgi:integrase
MGRPRYQHGHVKEQGTNWRGEYYVIEVNSQGKQHRKHCSVVLGERSKLTKTEAKKKLEGIIAAKLPLSPDDSCSLRWFVENKWLPIKSAKWKGSTLGTNKGILENQILKSLGDVPISDFDKVLLQLHLNKLAKTYSYSIVQHTCSFLSQIFDEAVEQDFLIKSPARSLEVPKVEEKKIYGIDNQLFINGKPFLAEHQLRALLAALRGRDRLVVMFAGLMALRPGEVFGLDWSNYNGGNIAIVRRVYRGELDSPKTPGSVAVLPVPMVLRAELDKYKASLSPAKQIGFIFATKHGTPVSRDNFSTRTLGPASGVAQIPFRVNFHILRRTWATHAERNGATSAEREAVLRHSSGKIDFVYAQGDCVKILAVMDKFANTVATDLPEGKVDTNVIPITPLKLSEFLPCSTTCEFEENFETLQPIDIEAS